VILSGVLDPVGGAAVRAALEPLAQKSVLVAIDNWLRDDEI
jgi:hypothetical protein